MKKMFTFNSKSRSRWMLLLLLLVAGVTNTLAQNVTVHPGNGSMLPSNKTGGGDSFYYWYGNATWKHEQLPLTITTGDDNNNLTNSTNGLTANGQLRNPANDIFASAADANGNKYLQIGKGNGMDTYMTVALPKGYRFTGYTIRFHRISKPNGGTTSSNNSGEISFGETNNSFNYTTTTNSTATNITPYYGGIARNNTTETFTIGRNSQTDTDMNNLLYFKLSNGSDDGRAYIQLDHVEFFFTAEYNTPTMIPATTVTNKSAVDIPFSTGKVDYGTFSWHQGGSDAVGHRWRISYDGSVHDMDANITLYEKGSTRTITAAENDFDGTAGEIVEEKQGSISSQGDYFKLDASLHPKYNEDGEAIYYIESPVWATSSASANAHKNPIGYRIVGATFDYAAGTSSTYVPATFKIQYESTGHGPDEDGTYGLNTVSGTYNWNPDYHTVWRIDQYGYIYGYSKTDGSILYLSVNGTNVNMVTTKPSADAGTFEVDNNQIRRKNYPTQYIGWQETVRTRTDDEGNVTEVTYTDEEGNVWNRMDRSVVIVTTEDHRSTYNEQSAVGGGAHGKYTFKIYDKTGTTPVETIEVDGQGGSVTVDGYNNDAIKIAVVGTGLIKGQLIMQALDPYIDHVDIVCQEQGGKGGKLTQQFNATDFSVRGGKFTFYVPEDFQAPAKFTFENLYSQYGDNTYYNETSSTNHARYYFLGSTYSDYENNDVYARYNNTDHRDASYTTKVACLQPGNEKYLFNNAATAANKEGGQFEEYPFSKALYASKVSGSFNDFLFTQAEMANNAQPKTAYLFTCDETRYNIAPTTATQHVYYAFYEMTIDMRKKNYRPNLEWTKVYAKDNTFYSANNAYKTDAMWGLKVTTDPVTDDQGTHSGYVTVSKLLEVIEKGLPEVPAQGTEPAKPAVQGLDSTGEKAPKDMSQILYIDGSNLMNIVENQTTSGGTTTTHKLSELKDGLAANALIYLPYGSTSSDNNFAYNTIAQYGEAPIFRGAGNIVLTDKNPFYAKYNIQVDAAKSATYTRQITKSTYTDETYATVILPFEIALVKGQHADDYGTLEFLQMNEKNATADDYNYMGKAMFFSTTNAEKVEANTPYALHVVENKGEDGVFTVNQPGAVIVATPAEAKSGNSLFSATEITSTGNLTDKDGKSSTYSFSHKGSFSGFRIPKKSPKTFYFANGGFYSSVELKDAYKTVDLLPFRSVYEVTSPVSAKVGFLHFIEGENNTTGIVDIEKKNYSGIAAGDGTITITAGAAGTYRIFSAAGQNANTVVLKAGETRTVNVPAGVYVVNGVKVLVK